ncbi:hypothetical protein K8S19_03425 [bacterium]|nr:hypothetical protein [bacterium]
MDKKENVSYKAFWKVAAANSTTVQKWPEWKQSIKITSTTASSGEFINKKSGKVTQSKS